jgi:hypothetical protein
MPKNVVYPEEDETPCHHFVGMKYKKKSSFCAFDFMTSSIIKSIEHSKKIHIQKIEQSGGFKK